MPLERYVYHLVRSRGRLLLILLVVVALLGLVGFYSTFLRWPAPVAGQYKVVFDAGSTGTRVHVFRFNLPVFRSQSETLVLLDVPLFAKYDAGGLSSFAGNPSGSRAGLKDLLTQAQAVVPQSDWSRTEVLLMATAGLRLLPPLQAEALLVEARSVLNESKFRVSTVDTIDGKLEAKLIYVMTDFVLSSADNDLSAAIVDLGGGSVQLAYQTTNDDGIHLEKFGKNKRLFLHSWLGFGLVAFRMKALEQMGKGRPHPCVPEWTAGDTTYEYGGSTVQVVARRTSGDHLKACVAVITAAVNVNNACTSEGFTTNTPLVCGLNGQWLGPNEPATILQWRLFSYIFDLALAEGLVKKGHSETRLTANDFLQSAQLHCDGKGVHFEWWKCIDLVYIYVLLSKGFKLDPDYPLMVTKKLKYTSPLGNDIFLEAAWPLGAAISAIKQEL